MYIDDKFIEKLNKTLQNSSFYRYDDFVKISKNNYYVADKNIKFVFYLL
jgi:hypothetical protein